MWSLNKKKIKRSIRKKINKENPKIPQQSESLSWWVFEQKNKKLTVEKRTKIRQLKKKTIEKSRQSRQLKKKKN